MPNFVEFIKPLAEEFQWNANILTEESSLVGDCGLDSLGMYELLLVLEDLDYSVDEDALLEWHTLGDVYGSYYGSRS